MRFLPVLLIVLALLPLSAALKCYESFGPLLTNETPCHHEYCLTKKSVDGIVQKRGCAPDPAYEADVKAITIPHAMRSGLTREEATEVAENHDETCRSEGCTTRNLTATIICCCKGDFCNALLPVPRL